MAQVRVNVLVFSFLRKVVLLASEEREFSHSLQEFCDRAGVPMIFHGGTAERLRDTLAQVSPPAIIARAGGLVLPVSPVCERSRVSAVAYLVGALFEEHTVSRNSAVMWW